MGCISSSNKPLYAFRRDDIYNVSVVRVQADQSTNLARHGFLELTRNEIVFVAPDQEPVAWALQHLRRYGLTGNIFSFESGRRCPNGPGIYTFRCSNAEQFYEKFQRCINSMSVLGDRSNSSIHHSYIFDRLESHQPHSNHYLEPTSVQLTVPLEESRVLPDSVSNDYNELNLNSAVSAPSTSLSAEIIHFPSSAPPDSNVSDPHNSNIYLEQPIRINNEHNNNVSSHQIINPSSNIHYKSALKTIIKSSSLDVPPDECAPVLNTTTAEAQKLYENVDTCVPNFYINNLNNCNNSVARSYANVGYIPKVDTHIGQSKCFQIPQNGHHTLTSNPIVNYIVLDLDHPRSPSQCSPQNKFGSAQSFLDTMGHTSSLKKKDIQIGALSCGSSTMPKGSTISDDSSNFPNSKMESSGSYTRIDFLKTFALMKSSANYTDFDIENDQEESRITRHSKFIHKSYSISE